MPLPPQPEFYLCYQFYLATERGRRGYERNRRDFNKLIWQLASPKWAFDDATYARSAAAFPGIIDRQLEFQAYIGLPGVDDANLR